ncbi:hypothetical protein H4219_005609 [Mycoemilia scoparia]|uniref:Uncharacterized protein n=1 Tax=Mycoemilia scoparia TaxID=417184 RepID=A0A9W7ZVF6_9FUNG|nr:hypothetical protein H4219_005609 [Mycoemilia scoparia]
MHICYISSLVVLVAAGAVAAMTPVKCHPAEPSPPYTGGGLNCKAPEGSYPEKDTTLPDGQQQRYVVPVKDGWKKEAKLPGSCKWRCKPCPQGQICTKICINELICNTSEFCQALEILNK